MKSCDSRGNGGNADEVSCGERGFSDLPTSLESAQGHRTRIWLQWNSLAPFLNGCSCLMNVMNLNF